MPLPIIPILPGLTGTGEVQQSVNDIAGVGEKQSAHLSQIIRTGGMDVITVNMAEGIVGAESTFRVDADNGSHFGLWQVGKEHAGKAGSSKDPATFRKQMKSDPVLNTKVARAVYDERGGGVNGLRAWTTYTSGAWKKYQGRDPLITWKQDAQTAADVPGDVVDTVADAVASPLDAIKDVFNVLFSASTWFRVGKVLLGVPLLLIGLVYLAYKAGGSPSPKEIVKKLPAARAARKVVPK